ncbi:hypothetical protein GCM10022393_05490 [Aquimarina addita]|uniref:SIMPL domain-containing protein n=1 Tax=Aquimarina addita TaxID=870485 RepID=A0ABP7XBE4_9FLAO
MNVVRKVSTTLLLICLIPVFGQEQKNTITVTGECIKNIEIEKFIVNVEFNEIVADAYQNLEAQSLKELQLQFSTMLQKQGINFDKFEEKKLYRITSGQYRTASYFFYATSAVEEVEKIVSIKMKGLRNTWVDVVAKEKTNQELAELHKRALADAQERALLIANVSNKKIGNITYIEDVNYKYQYISSSKEKEPAKYYIKVTFGLE